MKSFVFVTLFVSSAYASEAFRLECVNDSKRYQLKAEDNSWTFTTFTNVYTSIFRLNCDFSYYNGVFTEVDCTNGVEGVNVRLKDNDYGQLSAHFTVTKGRSNSVDVWRLPTQPDSWGCKVNGRMILGR